MTHSHYFLIPILEIIMKKTRIYTFTMLCLLLLLQLPMSAVAGQLLRHALPDEFSGI